MPDPVLGAQIDPDELEKALRSSTSRVPTAPPVTVRPETVERAVRAPEEPTSWSRLAGMLPAGVNEAIIRTLGMPVDAATAVINAALRGEEAIPTPAGMATRAIRSITGTGPERRVTEAPQIQEPILGSDWMFRQMGRVGADPTKFEPTTTSEALAKGAGLGLGSAIGGEAAMASMLRAGLSRVAPTTAEVLERGFGAFRSPSQTALNVATSVPSSAVGEVTERAIERASEGPSAEAPVARLGAEMATGLGTAGLIGGARRAAPAIRDYFAPFTEDMRKTAVGRALLEASANPDRFRALLQRETRAYVPGSEPTTFQATGDLGIGALERSVDTELMALGDTSFNQRRMIQNQRRVEQLRQIAEEGDPRELHKFIRSEFADLNTAENNAVEEAIREANSFVARLGGSMNPEEYGALVRKTIEEKAKQARDARDELYKAIDPTNSVNVVVSPVRARVGSLYEGRSDFAQPITSGERELIDRIAGSPDVVRFNDLRDLDQWVNGLMSEEMKKSGRSPVWGRLSQVKSTINDAIDNAVENQLQYEQQQRIQGLMTPEQTMESRLRQMWQMAPERLEPSFSPEASERLEAAKEAHKTYARMFGAEPVGGALETTGFQGDYSLPNAVVANKMFAPGTGGYEQAMAFRRAVDNDPIAIAAMQDYATMSMLRAARNPDGTIDPRKYDSWVKAHTDALRAFPELQPRFYNAVSASEAAAESAARRAQVVDNFEKSALGRVIGADNIPDMITTIGNMFNRPDSVEQFRQLYSRVASNPEALQGLRKTIAEHINSRFITPIFDPDTPDAGKIRGAQLQQFLSRNESALASVFSRQEIDSMKNIAADIRRSDMSLSATAIPGRSTTAQDIMASARAAGQNNQSNLWFLRTLYGRMASGAGAGASTAFSFGAGADAPFAAFLGAMAGGAYHPIAVMREAGITKMSDLMKEALLHPELARALVARVPHSPNTGSEASLATALNQLSLYAGARYSREQENRAAEERAVEGRVGRAFGGKIGKLSDHKAKAEGLIRAAERAKRSHGDSTKSILNEPDEAVAKALSIADKAI